MYLRMRMLGTPSTITCPDCPPEEKM